MPARLTYLFAAIVLIGVLVHPAFGQRTMPPAITRATTLPVRQFLTSGDAEQKVSDDGMFRKLFVRALKGEERADANDDGYMTAS